MSLAKAIINNAKEHDVCVLLNDAFPDSIQTIKNELKGYFPKENIFVFSLIPKCADIHMPSEWHKSVAIKLREFAISKIKPDIIHISTFFEGAYEDVFISVPDNKTIPIVATIYDLIPLLNPEQYLIEPVFSQHYYAKLELMDKLDGVLAISQSSVDEVGKYSDLSSDSIFDISSAVDDVFRKMEISEQERQFLFSELQIPKPFLMTIGVVEPRKNIENLIKAYAKLDIELQNKYCLVLACQATNENKIYLLDVARSVGVNKESIVFLGHITDEQLLKLYNLCELFVFPSLHEGFGLPPLEAMSCGAVAIASNTSSLPEVIGLKDAMFDPYDVMSISKCMERALIDEDFRSVLKAHASEQSAKFSWDITARKAIDAMYVVYSKKQHKFDNMVNSLPEDLINEIKSIPGSSTNADLLSVAWAVANNTYKNEYKKLLVDISVLVEHDARTGIQRVVRSILFNLLKNPPNGFVVEPVYCRPNEKYRYAANYARNEFDYEFGYDDSVVFAGHSDIFLGLDLTAHLFPHVVEQINQFRLHGVEINYIVYDLIPVLHPEWCASGMPQAFTQWLNNIIKTSDRLIAISKAVMDDIQLWREHHPTVINANPGLELSYFHLGADIDSSVPSQGIPDDAADILNKINSRPTVLMVSTLEPRKSHEQVLKSFEILWSQNIDINLVIIGKLGWSMDSFAQHLSSHSELGRRLFWLQGVSDEYLDKICNCSSLLMVASLAEGFGLPLIEAAQRHLPVMARDISVLREVAGQYASYFSGTEPLSVAEALRDWLDLYAANLHPKSEGMPWLTWKQSTEQLVSILTEN